MTDIQQNRAVGQGQKPEADWYLHGERIWLRKPQMPDAHHVFHWERDDEVWRYDPHRPYSQSMRDFLPIFERNYVHGNGRQFWLIIEDEQHVPIGTITYFNVDQRAKQAEVGLGLGDKTSWGRGYGAEAICTLVQYLFQKPAFARLYAETAMANAPARKAFARAGFSEVGQIFDPRSSGDPWVLLEIWKQKKEQTRK
ncbi:MAG TPA: GNAT family protein [Ktedonobacteraceae bacterium]|jgi:RimJ/RimL family protein N-acetyltransferase|nr:GNAT family protein [Ktedonobacteraceae bacterium]